MFERVRTWTSRKSVRGGVLLLIIVAATMVYFQSDSTNEVLEDTPLPLVKTSTAAELSGERELSLIGTVRAFTEAQVTAERGGQVVSVPVTLGQSVSAGQVIAVLENAAERAAVLQAEGAYEAALSASAQSSVSVNEARNNLERAQNSAISTIRDANTTINSAVYNNIDTFFTQPNAFVPGLRIDGQGQTGFLNAERVAYQSLLNDWQSEISTLSVNDNLASVLIDSKASIDRTITFIDTFITVFNSQGGNNTQYTDTELTSFSTSFTTVRSSLIGSRTAIDTALTNLLNAEDALARAELNASGGVSSASDAQVKQALGSLRAAEANLAETILRTPIAGTVNQLSVRAGDFISSFTTAARVANNDALEIVTFVSELERKNLSVGDTVRIEDDYSGTITEIAPAVDPDTRKIEVRVAAESNAISNGDTVTVTKEISTSAEEEVIIPLSAVKFELENGFIFQIEDGVLTSKPVTLGTIRGGTVEILDGLAADETFVVDARGLLVGTEVELSE